MAVMLIIQLSTKINLYREGPNIDSFRSTGVRFRDIAKDGKIQNGGRRPSWIYFHANHTTEYQDQV